MIRPRALVTLGAAVVLAAISVALAHAWLSEAAQQAARPAAPAPDKLQTRPLVVAARALKYGDRLSAEDVKLVPWPESAVPSEALHDLAWLERSVEGRPGSKPVVLRPMAANEPVLTSKISGFGTPSRLAATIAPGLRATTIRAQGAPDMAALIGAGDRVDVLIAREVSRDGQARELRSDVLLRDLRVLGLDEGATGAGAGRARAVTLEVSVEQAQTLAVAEKVGVLSLALRGMASRDPAESRPVSSHDLPAGPVPELLQPAALQVEVLPEASAAVGPAEVISLSKGTLVRVFRGLEVFDYEVASEGAGDPLGLIDAAKAGPGP